MSQTANYSVFKGGLNEAKNELTLSPYEATEIQNVEFNQDGSIVKCKGYVTQNISQLNDGASITGVYEFILSTGASYLIVCCGDKIYTSQDGKNFTVAYTGVTPGKYFQFATFSDYAIMVNGADRPLIFDSTTISIAPWWTDSSIPSLVLVWKNRLWMSGASSKPQNIWYSNAVDPTNGGITFLTKNESVGTAFESNYGGFIPVNVNDGQSITNISTFYNSIIIYKTASIHQLTGDSAIGSGGSNEFGLSVVNATKGCIAPRSVVNIYNEQYFIDYTGINKLSAAINQNIVGNIIANSVSTKLTKTIAGWNSNKINSAYAIHYETKKQVWFVIPDGSSPKNNKVIVLDYSDDGSLNPQGGPMWYWTIRTGFSAGCGTFYKSRPILGGYDGWLQKHDTSDSYDGVAIESYWGSSWFNLGNIALNKRLIRLDLFLEQVGNFDLEVELSWNLGDTYFSKSLNMQPTEFSLFGESLWNISTFTSKKVKKIRIEDGPLGRGSNVKIRFSNLNADEPFRILGFDFIYGTYGVSPK